MKNSEGVMKKSGDKQGVIFIIERAALELVKIPRSQWECYSPKNNNYELLNGRKENWMYGRKENWMYGFSKYTAAECQPEIAHEAIKAVLNSPLNKSGQLKALYVRTDQDVLIEIKPHARIPADYDGFAELMLQLLRRSCLSADDGTHEKVLRIVQGPVSKYLPANSIKIALSHSLGCEKKIDLQRYIAKISSEKPLVFVVGAMAYGTIYAELLDYVDEFILTEKHPDNAPICIKKICEAVHRK